MLQLRFFMQPPGPLFFPQIKSDKSCYVVNAGLGLPPGFHYSGLMPANSFCSAFVCVQAMKFSSLTSEQSDIRLHYVPSYSSGFRSF